jgi:dihydropteroate synthase
VNEPWRATARSRTSIMGVLNLTPDSFSGDGIYLQPDKAAERAQALVACGADLVDLGGESTRPGYQPVEIEEETARVIPALRAIVRTVDVPLSVDTSKSVLAERALAEGASIVNDVSGLRDPRMAHVVAAAGAALIVVHHGSPHGEAPLMPAIVARLHSLILQAEAAGVDPNALVVDPGLGMGKGWRQNLEIIRGLEDLDSLGKPVLVGPSRKGMIGRILGTEVHDRLEGSIALAALCIAKGADMVRVHDVAEIARAARMMDAIVRSN